jgi:WXG100 family type VII secretion target
MPHGNDDRLVVDFNAMNHGSQSIAAALKALDAQLQDLENDAKPLVATWDGQAKDAYFQRQRQWQQAAGDLKAILHDIKTALDESAATYLATENRNTQMFPAQ